MGKFFITHEFFDLGIVHEAPFAETLLPVIAELPLSAGRDIETVRFTFSPFCTEVIEVIVGAEGLEALALSAPWDASTFIVKEKKSEAKIKNAEFRFLNDVFLTLRLYYTVLLFVVLSNTKAPDG